MGRRAGVRKRGRRKPRRNKKTRQRRLRLTERNLLHIPTAPGTPPHSIATVPRSPGTPVKDEGQTSRKVTVYEIPRWSSPEVATRRISPPAQVLKTPEKEVRLPTDYLSDSDVLLLDSPGQKAFMESPYGMICGNDVFLPPFPVTPGKNLEDRVAKMSPLFRCRDSPECIFSQAFSPLSTPPTPGRWIDILNDLEF